MMSSLLFILLADGLALGVAAGLSKTDVEFIIFLAIMLHKVCIFVKHNSKFLWVGQKMRY